MLMSALKPLGELENATEFAARHIGPYLDDERHMLGVIGAGLPNFSRRALIDTIVPRSIARAKPMNLPARRSLRGQGRRRGTACLFEQLA